jgi:alkylhydroperoxidase/carboxymuconolactone decarboxylase family protein YurZ
MAQIVRFQETLRRLAIIDERFVEDEARLGLDPPTASALDIKTAALLRVAVSVATGSPGVCLEWSVGRALAAGASEDEIADVLLAIVPVAGLGSGRRLAGRLRASSRPQPSQICRSSNVPILTVTGVSACPGIPKTPKGRRVPVSSRTSIAGCCDQALTPSWPPWPTLRAGSSLDLI